MSKKLKLISESAFRERLHHLRIEGFDESSIPKLWEHYLELAKWNRRISLVGPGTADEIVDRHYAESLLGLELIGEGDETVVDVGSGGGFPGMVLAIARPDLKVTLVEPREKKWAFLSKMSRQLGLSSIAVNARVERPLAVSLELPPNIDIVTSRALVITPEIFQSLADHAPRARFLLWRGKEDFRPPSGYGVGRILKLPSGSHRKIVEILPDTR